MKATGKVTSVQIVARDRNSGEKHVVEIEVLGAGSMRLTLGPVEAKAYRPGRLLDVELRPRKDRA